MEETIWSFESLSIPLSQLIAYLAATTKILSVRLLTLGLFTCFISPAFIGTTLVAINTIHFEKDWFTIGQLH